MGDTKVHELKTWPSPFWAIGKGYKCAELRLNDRGFAAWDYMLLREWENVVREYTGKTIMCRITHVVGGDIDAFGALKDGYVMLSFKVLWPNVSVA